MEYKVIIEEVGNNYKVVSYSKRKTEESSWRRIRKISEEWSLENMLLKLSLEYAQDSKSKKVSIMVITDNLK